MLCSMKISIATEKWKSLAGNLEVAVRRMCWPR